MRSFKKKVERRQRLFGGLLIEKSWEFWQGEAFSALKLMVGWVFRGVRAWYLYSLRDPVM